MAETLAVIRDLSIIILAVLNIALIAVLLFVAIQVWRLIRLVMREFPEFLGIARQTLAKVEGTTDFVGTTVARPAIAVFGFIAAIRRFFHILALGQRERKEVRQ